MNRAAYFREMTADAGADPPAATIAVSVVIATRNRPASLVACLASVLSQRHPRFEVIVVDNDPATDETRELVSQLASGDGRVRYVRVPKAGASLARNRGWREARHPIVAFLDDDVVADPDWLPSLVRGFSRAAGIWAVTGRIVANELATPAQQWLEGYGGFDKGLNARIFDRNGHALDSRLYPYLPGTFGSGANIAVCASVLERIGGFDEALGPGTPARGGEDLAVMASVVLNGGRLAYEPSALVRHAHHREYEELRRVMLGYGMGLGAFLAKMVADDPRRVLDVARRAAPGIRYLVAPGSPKNARKSSDYPAELSRLELLGFVCGPGAYLIGRLRNAGRRLRGPSAAALRRRPA
jgi:glycosyltransferase involved in cell wall biosynthesis